MSQTDEVKIPAAAIDLTDIFSVPVEQEAEVLVPGNVEGLEEEGDEEQGEESAQAVSGSSMSADLPQLNHRVVSDTECTEAGNAFSIVPGTDCRQFYHSWAFGQVVKLCPAGLVFSVRQCTCAFTADCAV